MTIALALTGLSGCAQGTGPATPAPFAPDYQGAKTLSLGGDLIDIHATMTGARDRADVARYTDCVAAGHARAIGYGFARHVRTNVAIEGGIWVADAVYTMSPTLPQGLRTLDAEVTVQNCVTQGIPTV